MREARAGNGTMLGDKLDRLTHEVRGQSFDSPQDSLQHVCSKLSTTDPFQSAGVFRFDESAEAFEWLYLPQPPEESMTSSLERHRNGLSDMIANGDLFQGHGGDHDGGSDQYFVGFTAGNLNGVPVGFGLSSNRLLENDEIFRLNTFGLVMGLMAENLRLSSIVSERDEAGSTARLIGFIAHELRTPLTGMRGNIQLALMATRKGQHERIPTRLEAAIKGVDDMSELVQRLLDVSRLERGAFPMNLATGRLGDTLSSAVERFIADQEDGVQDVQINGEVDTTLAHDRESLERTICFLLAYARRYSNEPAQISMTVGSEERMAKLDITYEGSPFSGDDLAALSAPLSSTRPLSERSDDLSLELAFSRGVVQEHGGEVALHTDKPAPGHQTIAILLPNR